MESPFAFQGDVIRAEELQIVRGKRGSAILFVANSRALRDSP